MTNQAFYASSRLGRLAQITVLDDCVVLAKFDARTHRRTALRTYTHSADSARRLTANRWHATLVGDGYKLTEKR